MPYTYLDFFCGGGMAGIGLGTRWRSLFANDFDARKAAAFQANHPGTPAPLVKDVALLSTADIPGRADLAWASFPCQDLSLAGQGAGLEGARSGAFWAFWRLMRGLKAEGRAPRLIALENVAGAATSRGGRDLAAILDAVAEEGYRVGALIANAEAFTPQSRPRLFIIAAEAGLFRAARPHRALARGPVAPWHPRPIQAAAALTARATRDAFVWWAPAAPGRRTSVLSDILEDDAAAGDWRTPEQTRRLLALMAPLHRAKIEAASQDGARAVGAVFRRTRRDSEGGARQRAEVRFDGLAGCLRTPAGGSSKQLLLFVEGYWRASRFLRPREAARLMGLPDSYRLPDRASEALRLVGDGVAPPVVRHLARELLEPMLLEADALAA